MTEKYFDCAHMRIRPWYKPFVNNSDVPAIINLVENKMHSSVNSFLNTQVSLIVSEYFNQSLKIDKQVSASLNVVLRSADDLTSSGSVRFRLEKEIKINNMIYSHVIVNVGSFRFEKDDGVK